MFNELNNGRKSVKDGIDTKSMEFAPISNFVGKTVKVDGFFFTKKGKYGEQVVVVGNGYLVNMPKRAVEQFKLIYNDDTMLNAVLDGKLCLTDIKPISTNNGDTTAYTLTDV